MWGQLWGPWYPPEILGQKMTFCLAGLCSSPVTTIFFLEISNSQGRYRDVLSDSHNPIVTIGSYQVPQPNSGYQKV